MKIKVAHYDKPGVHHQVTNEAGYVIGIVDQFLTVTDTDSVKLTLHISLIPFKNIPARPKPTGRKICL